MRYKVISFIFAALALGSCTIRLDEGVRREGCLELGLSIESGTRAVMSSDELLSTATVKIYKADFSGLVREYVYAEAPAVIYLPADAYRVDIEAGESVKPAPAMASWEQKSYRGSAVFTIMPGQSTNVSVTAGVCNAVSCVSFDKSVSDNFAPGYTFTIGLDASDIAQQLVYAASDSGREGYFILGGFEPSFYWTFSGTLSSDGSAFSKSGVLENILPGRLYKMAPKFTVHDGTLSFDLFVDYSAEVSSDVVVFEPVSTGLSASVPSEIWAGHVTVHADVDESEHGDPSKVAFAYSADGLSWTGVPAVRKDEGAYEAVIRGLQESTKYFYKLVIDGEDVGDPLSFTTEEARQLPNWNFETVSNADSDRWVSFYDPASPDPSLQKKFWDNGSSASAGMLGASYAICYSDSSVPEGIGSTRSARLQSIGAAGKLAAGNLFTGEFAGLDGLNGKVNFGRAWTARPTAVRFWYKYKGGKVDKTASGCPLTENDYDKALIQVALGTWDYKKYGGTRECPVQVNTSNKATFWNYPDLPETIAYANLEVQGDGTESGWKQVTINLDYHSLTAFPAYIIVSGAASKYGDYFAGSTSSALWIDNMELIYE